MENLRFGDTVRSREARLERAAAAPAGAMEAHTECDRIDPERARGLRRCEVFPCDEEERLAVDLGELTRAPR